jgi:hypothetical protein
MCFFSLLGSIGSKGWIDPSCSIVGSRCLCGGIVVMIFL